VSVCDCLCALFSTISGAWRLQQFWARSPSCVLFDTECGSLPMAPARPVRQSIPCFLFTSKHYCFLYLFNAFSQQSFFCIALILFVSHFRSHLSSRTPKESSHCSSDILLALSDIHNLLSLLELFETFASEFRTLILSFPARFLLCC